MNWLTKEWLDSDQLRFGQLLINLGIIQDHTINWETEISDYPIPIEFLRNIQTWGTYGKDGKSYKELFIKDLDTNHIKSILRTQKHISDNLKNIFKNELNFRENSK